MSLLNSMWNTCQQRQITGLGIDTSRAQGAADKANIQLRQLEDKVDKLALLCQALWETIRETTKHSDEMIEKKVTEIDLRDGVQDGKMGSTARPCPNCNRAVGRRRTKCMYCGAEIEKEHVFQK